jgi:hypothetical protein
MNATVTTTKAGSVVAAERLAHFEAVVTVVIFATSWIRSLGLSET